MVNKKTNKKTKTRGDKVNDFTTKFDNNDKVKVGDVVTSTRGQKRGRVVQFTSDGTVVTVDFFDGTTQDFQSGNVRKS